ncbi:beta-ketoacyl-ACP synthase III [Pseudanabaena sp. PCC 6802]|uniref:beta-ketoacyl-ACP synthase III n=1 Tax=Pseudanabaena sp. PCC 6802 TaxID=118173 RepID=UPI00034D4C45|nr:beta-ketoacyl-ACP synthase III [Pseudanabaena sp. PCC 6802]
MHTAYINSIGKFLPNDPIANDEMEDFLGKIGDRPSKVRSRILKSNGIQQRYYALDRQQNTTHRTSEMAALAVRDALALADRDAKEIDLLAAATTWADQLVPSFASMVHGELSECLPLETASTHGVCCAGISALKYATNQVALGQKRNAIAVAAEMPSRLFKHSRFEAAENVRAGKSLPFDTEFLRWMLSDGAGAMLIQDRPNPNGISLKVEWIELISHANAYPVCMYAGFDDESAKRSWMEYSDYVEAAKSGALDLRQNIRLLDDVLKLGVEGWLRLIDQGRVDPSTIDWLLCHYSSHFFRSQIVELLEMADCTIPEHKWFTNLYTRGNTGCAAIYLMLEELFNSGKLQVGQKIFCFIPESGRFTTAYMLLSVVESCTPLVNSPNSSNSSMEVNSQAIAQNELSQSNSQDKAISQDPYADRYYISNSILERETVSTYLIRQLAQVWLEFERRIHSVPIVRRLERGEFTLPDYKALLINLRPQVVEGARWMARAASNMTDFQMRSTFIGHAQVEHRDFLMLEQNYQSVGGDLSNILQAEKNIGSEALSAFIFNQASQSDPIDLIGSMFVIEGLGNKLAGQWADRIQQSLALNESQVSFLAYHGKNDASHVDKLNALVRAEWMTAAIAKRIVKTAKVTARLYLLQLEEIG